MRGRLRRAGMAHPILGLVVMALVMTAGGISPSAAATPSRLAGLTIVTGSTSATSTVLLDRPATISITAMMSSKAVTISGGGRYAGFMLTRRSGGPLTSLEAVNVNFCNAPGCTPVQVQQYVSSNAPRVARPDGSHTVTLGAGTYELQLVADGTAVTVALKLDGLTGTSRIRPLGRSNAAIVEMTPTAGLTRSPAYSAGTTRPLAEGGSVIATLVTHRTASAGRQSGLCGYQGAPPPGGLYTEQCPGAFFGVQLLIPEVVVANTAREYGGVLGLPAGQWSVGQYEITAGDAEVLLATGLWLQP